MTLLVELIEAFVEAVIVRQLAPAAWLSALHADGGSVVSVTIVPTRSLWGPSVELSLEWEMP